MKQFLREYFTFNRRERNGVFVLLSLILLLILYLSFFDYLFPGEKTDFSKFKAEIAQFEAEQNHRTDSSSSKPTNYFAYGNSPEAEETERFPFDPNNLPEEDWMRLGLSEKQIRVIKNYESKGGKFRTKEDVKKMYCIPPKLFASLESYIQIPVEIKDASPSPSERVGVRPAVVIELNSADTTSLKTLKGIGSAFAKRIVKYREMLGGYASKEQLMEVYGFDRQKYDVIANRVSAENSLVRKLNINLLSAEELKSHPYIRWKLANIICAYRKNHGLYSSIESIKQTGVVNDSLYTRLAPYLTVE